MAYQKQESFMNAQSRAIGTLSNLIKQYVAMADEEDKRKQELSLMTAQINKLSLEVEKSQQEFKEQTADDEKVIFMTDTSEMEKWVEENGGF